VTTPGPESKLVKAILDHIKSEPAGHAVKVHGSQFTSAGEPDINACIAGRHVVIEVKQPGKKPTPIQFAAMRRWERVGSLAGWVTSLDEARELLSHWDDYDWANPQLLVQP